MSNGATTWNYTYDSNGLRTQRTNGTTTYTYIYNGSQLVQMQVGSDTLYFTYDPLTGAPVTVEHNGTVYYYITNLQGDVIGISGNWGNGEQNYYYDAWGRPISATSTTGIMQLNPLRYRGYVYDAETGLYYLQSRYYDPEIGRFINADAYAATGQGLIGNNMYAYCGNNPVTYVDCSGMRYCAATSVSKESSYDRFISCDYQRIVSLEKIGEIVDITKKLDSFMEENAKILKGYADTHNAIDTFMYFVRNVKDGGTLDIKLQNEWEFVEGKTYIYKGMTLRYDDPGNINFGYVGAELFPEIILCIGAGANQLTKPNVPHNVFSFFDDPRDTYMIKYGYRIYKGWY